MIKTEGLTHIHLVVRALDRSQRTAVLTDADALFRSIVRRGEAGLWTDNRRRMLKSFLGTTDIEEHGNISNNAANAGNAMSAKAAASIAALDATVVNIALPRIGKDFSIGLTGLQWTVNVARLRRGGSGVTIREVIAADARESRVGSHEAGLAVAFSGQFIAQDIRRWCRAV